MKKDRNVKEMIRKMKKELVIERKEVPKNRKKTSNQILYEMRYK